MEASITLTLLETELGQVPFEEWYFSLRDPITRIRILNRIERLKKGNFGDVKHLGEGVSELRLQFGAGYRIYFGMTESRVVVVLLGGGDKSSQKRDIVKAQTLWRRYKHETQRFRSDFTA
jgi:putative addiction module killer protein